MVDKRNGVRNVENERENVHPKRTKPKSQRKLLSLDLDNRHFSNLRLIISKDVYRTGLTAVSSDVIYAITNNPQTTAFYTVFQDLRLKLFSLGFEIRGYPINTFRFVKIMPNNTISKDLLQASGLFTEDAIKQVSVIDDLLLDRAPVVYSKRHTNTKQTYLSNLIEYRNSLSYVSLENKQIIPTFVQDITSGQEICVISVPSQIESDQVLLKFLTIERVELTLPGLVSSIYNTNGINATASIHDVAATINAYLDKVCFALTGSNIETFWRRIYNDRAIAWI